MNRNGWLAGLAALTVIGLLCSMALADKTPVKSIKEWSGSVDDETLLKGAPSVITNADALQKLWKDWKVGDKAPEVDFSKELVVITTTVGSRLSLAASLDADKGDLQVGAVATRDLRPGFRYVIATVSREGVKTVNGKELPKD
jgi:hypothetical protein